MTFSKIGLGLVIIFIIITMGISLYDLLTYKESGWMWGVIFGGMPWSLYGLSIGFFATSIISVVLSWGLIAGSYFLNIFILYSLGVGIEKIYKKLIS